MRFHHAALFLFVLAPVCALDAIPYIDLRGTIGGGGGITEVEVDGGETDYDNRLGLQLAAEAILRQRFSERVGYCVGAGLFLTSHIGEDQDDDDIVLVYSAGGLELTGGLTFQVVHGFHLELRPFWRLGRGTLHVENDGDGPVDDEDGDSGPYQALGALLGGYYTFPFGLQLGGQFGAEGFSGESDLDVGEVTVTGGGLFLRAAVGYSF